MGLDMYLTRKTYVMHWDHHPPERRWVLSATLGGKPVTLQQPMYVEEQVAYWRKANQIHKWFVDTLADGTDECQPLNVSREELEKLIDLCEQVIEASELREGAVTTGWTLDEHGERKPMTEQGRVIADATVADDLLPSTSGFFFGSTDYDEWYIEDLRYTVKALREALVEDDKRGTDGTLASGEYIYQASW